MIVAAINRHGGLGAALAIATEIHAPHKNGLIMSASAYAIFKIDFDSLS